MTGSYFVKALGNDAGEGSKAPMNSQVCGQCHNEYYFDGETKATTNPYTGLDQMTPGRHPGLLRRAQLQGLEPR